MSMENQIHYIKYELEQLAGATFLTSMVVSAFTQVLVNHLVGRLAIESINCLNASHNPQLYTLILRPLDILWQVFVRLLLSLISPLDIIQGDVGSTANGLVGLGE